MRSSPRFIIYQYNINCSLSITSAIHLFVRLFFKTIPDFISLHSKTRKYRSLRHKDLLKNTSTIPLPYLKDVKNDSLIPSKIQLA